ncbi:MAG TPA: RnfH family protein [Steroidobacteraceae bacterium]|nr:RnfH family protein [Steroidobacteraceae bacterium]
MTGRTVHVEVAYALAQRAILKAFELAAPATVQDALRAAGADADFSGIDLDRGAVGVFGTVVRRDHPLRSGDRVEIYRPLPVDPKAARRARAKDKATGSARSRASTR